MCDTKDAAKKKLDRLIEAIERLTVTLAAAPLVQPQEVNEPNVTLRSGLSSI